MARFRIGIRPELLGGNLRRAIERARQIGYETLQLDAQGELAPEQLSQTGRQDLTRFIRSQGLQLSAWQFPVRLAPDVDPHIDGRLQQLAATFRLAFQTQAPIVVASVGRIPADPEHPTRRILHEFLTDVAGLADRWGAVLAIETGNEPGEVLAALLRDVGAPTVQCTFDPANLVVKGYDPLAAFETLYDRIVHCHAWDARLDATSDTGTVVQFGTGDVPWRELVNYLREAAFAGSVIVEKLESGTQAAQAATVALQYLKRIR